MFIGDRMIDANVRSDAGGVVFDEVVYSLPVWRERWVDLMRHAGRVGAMPVMVVRSRCSVAGGDLALVRLADLESLLERCRD